MLEAKWSAVKATYQKEQNKIEDFCKNNGQEYMPTSFSYRTNVTPVWRWSNKGITTFSIEDECYKGAHMVCCITITSASTRKRTA